MSEFGTNRPWRLPLGLVWKWGVSCQWCARVTDFQQWKVDRPSAMRQSSGEDDPKLSSACRAAFRLLPGVAGTHVELVCLTPHQTK